MAAQEVAVAEPMEAPKSAGMDSTVEAPMEWMKKTPVPTLLKVDYTKGEEVKPDQITMGKGAIVDRDGDGIPDDIDSDVDDYEYIPAQRLRGCWLVCAPMPCPFLFGPVMMCPDGDHKLKMYGLLWNAIPWCWAAERLPGTNHIGKTYKKGDGKAKKLYWSFDNECINCFCSGDPTDGTVKVGDCPMWSCKVCCLPGGGPRWKHTDPDRTV